MIFLTTLLFSVFITIALIPITARVAGRIHLFDLPNERKVHSIPVPRVGGIAIAIGALVPLFFWIHLEDLFRWYLIGAGIIILAGFIDDVRGLDHRIKFAAQTLAALVVIFPDVVSIESVGTLLGEGTLLPNWLSVPLTLVAIVGVTNAINLADGLDGLAGGVSLLSFCCIGLLAYLVQDRMIALLSIAMAGAILGFLRFNTHPASIFMGDTGSQFLGFSAIVLSLRLTQDNPALSPLLPLLIVGFPVLDTIVVMAQRLQEKRPLFSADRNHFHHRLMRLGFYQTESVLIIYILQAGLVTAALLLRFYSEWVLLIGYLTFSVIITGLFTLADKRAYRLKRSLGFDRIIKGKLRQLREKGTVIKPSFRVIEYGIPCLLLFTSFLPARVPRLPACISLAAIGIMMAAWWAWRNHLDLILRGCLYLFVPYAIYAASAEPVYWMTGTLNRCYNASFFIFAVFIVLTMRFSRRRFGFQSTPMDFLVLFIALVVPNLPVMEIRSYHLGIMAAKTITLLYSYEVLLGELRDQFGKVTMFTLAALAVITAKGLF